MENSQTQFLEDLLSQIHSLKKQLEEMESMVAGHMPATTIDEDLPEETVPETAPEAAPEAVPEAPEATEAATEATVHAEAALSEDIPVLPFQAETIREEPLPVFGIEVDDAIEVVPIGEARHASGAVMDKMAEKESWRTDMPGTSVSDIRSAISLNDRILFINTLFHEDPIAFKNAISSLNAAPSFSDGVKFILGKHPEWNTGSDVVYRFMMAVRRKLK